MLPVLVHWSLTDVAHVNGTAVTVNAIAHENFQESMIVLRDTVQSRGLQHETRYGR